MRFLMTVNAGASAPDEQMYAEMGNLIEELTRVAQAGDIDEGLRIVDRLIAVPALAGYHHVPSVRGDLLTRLGRHAEAAGEFRRAASLTRNGPERTMLLRRAGDCDAHQS